MRVVQNDKYIKSRGLIGRYAFFAGFGVLILGLIISIGTPREPAQAVALLPLSFLCLIAGFALSQFGGYYVRRFDRGELPHVSIAKALKGFDDRYTLANYRTPASHVLLAPDAVYVIIPKAQAGTITYQNGRWRNPMGISRVFTWMTEESLGNPVRDAAGEVARLQRYLARELPDISIEIQPVIVFLNPKATVEAEAAPVPALHIKKFKDWLRGRTRGGLSRESHAALSRLLIPASPDKTSEA